MTWIVPKLDWLSTDKINFADWNRIENNAQVVADYLNSIGYTIRLDANPYALSFDGVDDYVLGSAYLGINGDASLTLEAWVYWNGAFSSNFPSFMGLNTSGVDNTGLSITLNNGTPALDFWNARIRATNAITANTWTHIAATKTPGVKSSTIKIYVNAVLQTSTLEGVDTAPNITNAAPVVGRLDNAATRYWSGGIDEVRFWNVARTQAEIQASMNSHLIGNELGLVGYWKFDEGTGLTAFDSTVNGNNGTLTGGPIWTISTPIIDNIIKSRDISSVDKLSSINRIEQNIETIRTNFITPPGYLGTRVWTVSSLFDFNDAIRLESDVNLLYNMGILVFNSFIYCGTFNAGEDGLIY